jgi:hypothetical protein
MADMSQDDSTHVGVHRRTGSVGWTQECSLWDGIQERETEAGEEEPTYRIERKFGPGFGRDPIVVSEGVSLEYAQAHCSSPDSSGTDGEWQ